MRSASALGHRRFGGQRRVIGKAEITTRGPNPRFLVTSLQGNAATVYERIYCARGEMENRIKGC